MRDKRGLSGVVTTVLIILIVIVAVGILWGTLRPTIEDGSNQITASSACFSVEVKPTACTATATGGDVTVQLVADGGADVTEVVGILQDAGGATNSSQTAAPEVLGTADATVDGGLTGTTGDTYTATAAARINVNGESVLCPESTAKVTCDVP